jgi:hypothetical protein
MNKTELLELLEMIDACSQGKKMVRDSQSNDAHEILRELILASKNKITRLGYRMRSDMSWYHQTGKVGYLSWFIEEASRLLNHKRGMVVYQTYGGLFRAAERIATDPHSFMKMKARAEHLFKKNLVSEYRGLSTTCCRECDRRKADIRKKLREYDIPVPADSKKKTSNVHW